MKRIKNISLTVFLLGICFSYGQKKEKMFPRDRFIFDVNYNSWLNEPNGFDQIPWKSVGVGFNFYKDIPLGYSANSFAWGLSYTVDKVHSNVSFLTRANIQGSVNNYTLIEADLASISYRENKFVTHYIDLPIELRLRTKGNATFHTHFGFKGGMMVNNFSRSRENGVKVKKYNIPDVNRFRYGPTLRIGYSNINFYGFYNMTSLFSHYEDSFTPFTIGISYFTGRDIF